MADGIARSDTWAIDACRRLVQLRDVVDDHLRIEAALIRRPWFGRPESSRD